MKETMRFEKNHDQYNPQFSNNQCTLEYNYTYSVSIIEFLLFLHY